MSRHLLPISAFALLLCLTAPAAAQRNPSPGYRTPASASAPSQPSYYTQDYTGPVIATQDGDSRLANIRVRLPANAELWIDSNKTKQQGAVREFVTPNLDPEHVYTYPLRARWVEDGITVEKSIKVKVFAGSRVTINFVRPPARRLAGVAPTPALPATVVPARPIQWTAPDSFHISR